MEITICRPRPEAQEAIYGFIYNHDSQAQKVSFWNTHRFGLRIANPRPPEAEVKVHPGYMLSGWSGRRFPARAFVPEAQCESASASRMRCCQPIACVPRPGPDGKAEWSVYQIQQCGRGIELDARSLPNYTEAIPVRCSPLLPVRLKCQRATFWDARLCYIHVGSLSLHADDF